MVKASLNTYYQTALHLQESGKLEKARKLYKEILKLKPNHLESLFMLGQSYYQEADFDAALEHYKKGLKIKPEAMNFLIQMAATYVKLRRADKAELVLEGGIDKTGNPQLKVNLGIVRSQRGKYTEALEAFESVGLNNLTDQKVLFHCAKSLVQVGRLEEGIATYLKCLKQNPTNKGALNNLANVYQQVREYQEAIKYYQKLIKHHPGEAMGYNNLAGLFEKLDNIDKSIQLYKKAIEIDPALAIAWYNLVRLMMGKGSYQEALHCCEKGLEQSEGDFLSVLRYQQILLRQQLCVWEEYAKDGEELKRIIQAYLDDPDPVFDIAPYDLSYTAIDSQVFKNLAEKYASIILKRIRHQYPTVSYNLSLSEGKIKVGYYSPNFRQHPGGYLVRKLFEHHNSSEFEIHAFSLTQTGDHVNLEIQNGVDYYHDVSKLSSIEIADLINRTGIDILVALAGYNVNMKMDVLALRPAPIQMMMLGSHLTTGAPLVDYVFSDQYMMNEQLRSGFSENVITLPTSLLLNSELPTVNPKVTNKTEYGLPNDKFVFASFNHPKKIDPATFECWMEILKNVPDSILWLYDAGSEVIRSSIIANAKTQSISTERIVFAKPLSIEKHWERFQYTDLILDTFIYNAHFTGIEILRLGKPILTLKGNNHNNMLCSSMLHYAGLDQLVTESESSYRDRAIYLSNNTHELRKIEEKLTQSNQIPLFDTELQVKYLEKAFKMVVFEFKKTGQSKDLIVKSLLKFDAFN